MQGLGDPKAPRSAFSRSAVTNDWLRLPGIDGRSPAARRFRDLAFAFANGMGGPDALTDHQRVQVQKAAGLSLAAEEARGKAARGEPVDIGELVRLEGAADRALRALRINAKATPKPNLRQYLASKQPAAA